MKCGNSFSKRPLNESWKSKSALLKKYFTDDVEVRASKQDPISSLPRKFPLAGAVSDLTSAFRIYIPSHLQLHLFYCEDPDPSRAVTAFVPGPTWERGNSLAAELGTALGTRVKQGGFPRETASPRSSAIWHRDPYFSWELSSVLPAFVCWRRVSMVCFFFFLSA